MYDCSRARPPQYYVAVLAWWFLFAVDMLSGGIQDAMTNHGHAPDES
jgi:hypothetical protein